jgi:hypothetical protein
MRKILLILTFLFLINALTAQETYTINEYGTYVTDSKTIKKVPSDRFLIAWKFWKNYVVFGDFFGHRGITVFNIENSATVVIKEDLFAGHFKILDDDKYLTFACNGYITKLDLISLEVVEKYYAGEKYNYKDIIPIEWEDARETKLGNRTVRYYGRDSYIDLIYGEKIDMEIWEGVSVVTYDKNLKWFAIQASPFPFDGK